MKCATAILEDLLTKVGCSVARHPCMSILCPLMVSFLLTTGIQKAKILQNIESLYAPSKSFAIRDRTYLESLFPVNLSSNFYPERYTREGSFGSAIVVANDGDSVLRPHIFKEVLFLDQAIQEITVYWDSRQWNYSHICARRKNVCFKNSIFNHEHNVKTKDKYNTNTDLKNWFNLPLFTSDYSVFGRVFSKGENESFQVKALRIFYYLDDSTESRKYLAYLWEDAFIDKVKSLNFSNISVEVLSSKSLENISWRNFRGNVVYAFIVLCIMAICWLVITFKPNCFRGKPWMGVVIAISSGLAVTSGHGLLMYCQLRFVPSTSISIFVVLGITTVDTLAMNLTWKETDSRKSVVDRLGETYSEIGIPIMTSFLINFVSILVGIAFSPFQEYSIFCFYMSSCLVLGFLYQLTLIGGCLAAFGYAEKKNLHSLTFRPVQITTVKGNNFSFCSRGGWQTEFISSEKTVFSPSSRNNIFGQIKKGIAYAQTKSFLIILYLVYLATSIWGITSIEYDYTYKEAISQDNYASSYFQKLRENFSQYHDRIQIILNTTLNYADPSVQSKISAMLDIYELSEYGNFQTKSWLRNYLKFLSNKKVSFLFQNYNVTDKYDFIYILRHHFLRYIEGREFMNDIVFDEGSNDIIASRFLLRSYSSMNEESYWKRLQHLRYISNREFFPTIIFHPKLFVYEGTDLSLPTTIIQLCTKALITSLTCSVVLSSIIHAIIILCSYISVCIGVLGYMNLWDVGMNPVSMKYLMCFSNLSINYLVHSTYSYSNINRKADNNLCWKIKLVILHGSIIMMLSVAIVFIRPSWILTTAFKVGFLTSVFAGSQTICFQTILISLYNSFNDTFVKWSTASCSKKRDCRIPGKFQHPTIGGIYNGSVVISHIDLAS